MYLTLIYGYAILANRKWLSIARKWVFMFTNMSDFLSVGLGTLIAGARELCVLFATYENVAGYESRPVETGKNGLVIQVRNGNQAALGGKLARAAVESPLKIKAQEGVLFLAVIYAGLPAFDEAVAFAREIKHEHPVSKVVVVTCDCNLTRKARDLVPMLRRELDAVVVTSECGGRATMRDILEKVVSIWPMPVRVPA